MRESNNNTEENDMIELKDLVPGAIALHRNGSLAIVTAPNPRSTKYPVLYKMKAGSNGYKGSPADFTAVLGVVDLDAYNAAETASAPAKRPDAVCPDFLLPDQLKGLKVGDTIVVRHGYGEKEVKYLGFKPNRPKYPLQYQLPTGGEYKGTLGAFVRKAA